jgi:hypothetical protein
MEKKRHRPLRRLSMIGEILPVKDLRIDTEPMFWPKGAVTAKVGIVIAAYGFLHYHAPGM